jgi:DNA polymerase-3 subunit alpha
LDGLPKVDQVAERFKECGYTAGALTDHGVVGGVPSFFKAMKTRGLKGISGSEFYLSARDCTVKSPENRPLSHLVVLAKDRDGWRNLMRASTASFHRDHLYYKPRLDLDRLASFSKGKWIVFSGHLGSDLANACFPDPKLAYRCRTYDEAAQLAKAEWNSIRQRVDDLIRRYQGLFGKENFYLEIQLVDQKNLPASLVVAKILRDAAKRLGVPKVATADSHYCRREDAPDQRVLLCSSVRTTMGRVQTQLEAGEDVGLGAFFRSNSYHVPTLEEMRELHSDHPEELAGAVEIASRCEEYAIGGPPLLPRFPCPDGLAPDEYFKRQCEKGWQKKIFGRVPSARLKEYEDRLWVEEYPVITGANLPSYFLIVQDYIRHARETLKRRVGHGRGCLTGDAPILLSNGRMKPIREVVPGDEVLTRDGLSRVVLQRFEYTCDEQLVQIECNFGVEGGVTLTADHKVYGGKAVFEGKVNRPPQKLAWLRADEIRNGDWLFHPTPKPVIAELNETDLSEFCDGKVLIHDDQYVYQNRMNWNTIEDLGKKCLRRFVVDDDWAFVLGYFAGNGWMCSGKNYLMGFSFHAKHTEKYDRIHSVVSKVFPDIHRDNSSACDGANLVINSRYAHDLFAKWFPDYECTSATKHVPNFIKTAPDAVVVAFLKGYFAADGGAQKHGVLAKSVSKRLMEEIRWLLQRLEIGSSLTLLNNTDKRPEFKNCKQVYQLYVHNDPRVTGKPRPKSLRYVKLVEGGLLLKVKAVGVAPPAGTVYDLMVDCEHNYSAGSFLVHNSGAGCLAGYLLDITQIDPIKYKLMFSRFLNAGRLSKDKMSLPDYDTDFPPDAREPIIAYVREKYGHDRVCQMATFGRMQGRSALKEVLRAHERCNFEEMNQITEFIPDEAAIQDELQAMREDGEEPSIIRWALEHHEKQLRPWAFVREDSAADAPFESRLDGPLALDFAQAIRLEGKKKSMGKHPSGLVICSEPVDSVCPMVYDGKGDELMTAVDYREAEEMGLPKFDILGLSALACLEDYEHVVRTGKLAC